ncbi:hypothetical protein AM571_PC01423 (plasmid) [Rhizobium etli 8C-3]|uniref:Uncharacterized protein n=1 Tax=Rhizobium etli 8C-3 TaxID=538025 RepID=A0A1L5PGE7_RHIET|nr:hypothetical protein AM571_PC01423 [Rhizobium etli 8C-3]
MQSASGRSVEKAFHCAARPAYRENYRYCPFSLKVTDKHMEVIVAGEDGISLSPDHL